MSEIMHILSTKFLFSRRENNLKILFFKAWTFFSQASACFKKSLFLASNVRA